MELTDENVSVKKLDAWERAGLAVLLILTLGSFTMIVVSSFSKDLDPTVWITILLTTLSFVGGLLIGSNRQK